jgi:DNA-directed RNA polymerase specialized sigma subunit
MQDWDRFQCKRVIFRLAQHISQLPPVQKKVLAMYFFENMPLGPIATSLGLSEIRTCQILVETIDLLQRCFESTPQKIRRNASPDQQAEATIPEA